MSELPGIETADREELQALQLGRLRTTVERLITAVPPMRERLHGSGVRDAREIASLADAARLPFTRKRDLREHYPWGLFAVPREEIARVHASSGTSGKPTLVGYTRGDLETWAECVSRTLALAGIRPGMIFQNMAGYGLFTGGLGVHMGAERLGCTVVPAGTGFTRRQITLLVDLGVEAIHATPSYALNLAGQLAELGVPRGTLRLRIAQLGAEAWSESLRSRIEAELGVTALDNYGLSEMCGPGVAAECEARNGMHVLDDHFFAEIVDPHSGEPLPDGADGELVFTTLTKEALPMLRYRTGDIASLVRTSCSCGRTTTRMSRVKGRIDDMLIIRGVNLYPSEIERTLLGIDGIGSHYQVVVERTGALDELRVECEPAAGNADAALAERAARALREETGLHVQVTFLPVGAIPRSEGKAVRVIDRRDKEQVGG